MTLSRNHQDTPTTLSSLPNDKLLHNHMRYIFTVKMQITSIIDSNLASFYLSFRFAILNLPWFRHNVFLYDKCARFLNWRCRTGGFNGNFLSLILVQWLNIFSNSIPNLALTRCQPVRLGFLFNGLLIFSAHSIFIYTHRSIPKQSYLAPFCSKKMNDLRPKCDAQDRFLLWPERL